MTEKFRDYLRTTAKSKGITPYEVFMDDVGSVIDEVLGPKTTSELWELFSANPLIKKIDLRSINMRDNQYSLMVSLSDIIYMLVQGLERGDEFLRTIQAATDKELYPGSFEDLGVKRKSE